MSGAPVPNPRAPSHLTLHSRPAGPPLDVESPPPHFTSSGALGPESHSCVRRWFVAGHSGNDPSEDRHFVQFSESTGVWIGGVLDGHGGGRASTFGAEHLPRAILSKLTKSSTPEQVRAALRSGFLEVDQAFIQTLESASFERGTFNAGSCAVVALVKDGMLYVANVGDCRAVLCTHTTTPEELSAVQEVSSSKGIHAVPMSIDHTCRNNAEVAEVKARSSDPDPIRLSATDFKRGKGPKRVAGSLMVTRALGDAYLKHAQLAPPPFVSGVPYITAEPEIVEHRIVAGDGVLVLASDGVWDMVTNLQVAQTVLPPSQSPPGHSPLRPARAKPDDHLNAADRVLKLVLTQTATALSLTLESLIAIPPRARRRLHDDITVLAVVVRPSDAPFTPAAPAAVTHFALSAASPARTSRASTPAVASSPPAGARESPSLVELKAGEATAVVGAAASGAPVVNGQSGAAAGAATPPPAPVHHRDEADDEDIEDSQAYSPKLKRQRVQNPSAGITS